jgi:hypothetical protein
MNDQEAFAIAVEEAKIGYREGGVPVRCNPPPFSKQCTEDVTFRLELVLFLAMANYWGEAITCEYRKALLSIM